MATEPLHALRSLFAGIVACRHVDMLSCGLVQQAGGSSRASDTESGRNALGNAAGDRDDRVKLHDYIAAETLHIEKMSRKGRVQHAGCCDGSGGGPASRREFGVGPDAGSEGGERLAAAWTYRQRVTPVLPSSRRRNAARRRMLRRTAATPRRQSTWAAPSTSLCLCRERLRSPSICESFLSL